MKKVSIVIPIYNAEDFLGYCLNSVLSQTYTNFEAILVNDCSTDKSLQICKSFANLDERFKVVNLAVNGGVSNARNIGIKQSTGDYLTLIDSDDVVDLQYIEKMVNAMDKYQTKLVVSNLLMVDFLNPDKKWSLNASSYSNHQPAVISKQEFLDNAMTLIWKTSLLESGCGKMVDLKLWKQNNITLDTGLSLGEDFMANLKYYSVANGVVFLNEDLYYYNNIEGSNSLSHIFREDIFTTKMYLAKELQKWLGDLKRRNHEEKKNFYNYCAAYGITSIENVLMSNISQKTKRDHIGKILDSKEFIQYVKEATYIKHGDWKKMILNHDETALSSIKISNLQNIEGGSYINKIARRSVSFYYTKIKHDTIKMKKINNEITMNGVKNTIKNHLRKKN